MRSACCAAAAALALVQPALGQPPPAWSQMPRMQLERQFAGPLQDTIIQRWRDPTDGTICYLYLPITAPHSSPTQSGYVQYGPNSIGSISCAAPPAASPSKSTTAKAVPPPAPAVPPPPKSGGASR